MSRRLPVRPVLRAAAVAAVLASSPIGCGFGDESSQRDGGELRVGYSSQPDSLDPALSYSVEGWSVLWNVYLPLLSYRHEAGIRGTEPIPALARALPSVSADRRVYRLRLRDGLRYSDGTPVRASDFEHSVRRILRLESGASKFFLGVVGARAFLRDEDVRDIEGIEADDASGRIRIELLRPDGTFPYVLALPMAGLVPSTTEMRSLTADPPPGAGPFAIAGTKPNREIVLERNPRFVALPDIPEARVDRVRVSIGANPSNQTLRTMRNQLDYALDPVPADLREQVLAGYGDRFKQSVTNSTYFVWLNSSLPPFDDPAVRRAVHRGLDTAAFIRLFGGAMDPDCNFLPPGIKGYEPIEPCPGGEGDVEAAREILEERGVAGTEVDVWGNSLSPTKEVTESLASQLREMGFRTRVKLVSASVYSQTVGSSRTPKTNIGVGNWFQDFPHPASFFAAVRGDLITPVGNYNFSRTDKPELTAAIRELQQEPDLGAVAARWAALDREVVEDADLIPYGHLRLPIFTSERVDSEDCAATHPVFLNDYSRFCLD